MKQLIPALSCVLLFAPLAAMAAPAPGLWQLTYTIDGKPPAPESAIDAKEQGNKQERPGHDARDRRGFRGPVTVEYCLTPGQNPHSVFFTAESDKRPRPPMPCTLENVQDTNGQASWDLICQRPQRHDNGDDHPVENSIRKGQAQYTDNTYNGSQNLPPRGHDKTTVINRVVTGKRLGDCPN